MSASDKKKLRKELNAAVMTEKQLTEQKQQKKLKTVTTTFIVVMILVVALVIGSVISTPITRVIVNNTIAAKVNGHEITAGELNYFYFDAISNLYSQFSSYGNYQNLYMQLYTGVDPTKPLDEQKHSDEVGTWADYFVDTAITNAQWVYAMCDAAEAEGYKLSEDEQKSIDSTISTMSLYASLYGFQDVTAYIRGIYGVAANEETYKAYYTKCQLASSYAGAYIEGLEFDNDDFRAHEKDKMNEFNSYSWASYYITASSYKTFLKLGTTTKDENGKDKTTYTEEEEKKALEAAKAAADKLMAGEYKDLEALNKAIGELDINKDAKTPVKANEFDKLLHASAKNSTPNEDALKWLTDKDRKEGDMTLIPATTKDSKGNETTVGYYVLYYKSVTDNSDSLVGTVRHLLVAFEKDKDGKVTDKAKEAAKLEAHKLLEEYKLGKKTEEAFTALIAKHSDDSKDGLYEDIHQDSGYVTEFKNWAIAKHEVGDVEIIETEYGFHIMYYVSCNELSYRDLLIDNELRNEHYEKWEKDTILKGATSEELNLKHIDYDCIMSSK